MNQDIQRALLDLFSVCLEVTGAGRYDAHMQYSAHTDSVHVYVLPAATNYQDTSDREYRLDESMYISGVLAGTTKQALARIKALTSQVSEFLSTQQEEAA